METLRIQKGLDLNIGGKPAKETDKIVSPDHVAVLPETIPFIKPRLRVKEGDTVQMGSILCEDKRNPDVKFLSPGGGAGMAPLRNQVVHQLNALPLINSVRSPFFQGDGAPEHIQGGCVLHSMP